MSGARPKLRYRPGYSRNRNWGGARPGAGRKPTTGAKYKPTGRPRGRPRNDGLAPVGRTTDPIWIEREEQLAIAARSNAVPQLLAPLTPRRVAFNQTVPPLPPIISAEHALWLGLEEYFTGQRCERGHLSTRRVRGGQCFACYLSRHGIRPRIEGMLRREAAAKGLKTYFTGKPCVKGHLAPKRINGGCEESTRLPCHAYAADHKAEAAERRQRRYNADIEASREKGGGATRSIARRSARTASAIASPTPIRSRPGVTRTTRPTARRKPPGRGGGTRVGWKRTARRSRPSAERLRRRRRSGALRRRKRRGSPARRGRRVRRSRRATLHAGRGQRRMCLAGGQRRSRSRWRAPAAQPATSPASRARTVTSPSGSSATTNASSAARSAGGAGG